MNDVSDSYVQSVLVTQDMEVKKASVACIDALRELPAALERRLVIRALMELFEVVPQGDKDKPLAVEAGA